MALEFTNNGGANVIASVASFTPPAAASTVMFWLNMNSLVPALQRILGTATNFEIRIASTGIVTTDLYNNSDGAIAVTALTTGTWFHIASPGELTGGNSITSLYINGVLDAGPTTVVGSAVVAATMTIGNRTGIASTQGLNGIMDDFRVYNRLLTANEIRTIYQARGTDGIAQGLVLRTMFDEQNVGTSPVGAGVVKDSSSGLNNYTPTGSPVYRASVLRLRRKVT